MHKFIFFISILFIGCTKVLDSSFLNSPSEIIVQSYLCPTDTIIKVNLTKSSSFVESEIPFDNFYIKNAIVTISDNETANTLKYNTQTNLYEIENKNNFIKPGNTYFLKVVTIDKRNVFSQTSVPKNTISATKIEVEKSLRGSDLIDIRLKWLSNKNDFYIIKPYYYRLFNNSERYFPQNNQYFNGSEAPEMVISNYFTNDLSISLKKNTVFFYVVDENYYKYSKTLQLNKNNQDDPFSQPINAITNIKGGKGCFGSYNVTRLDYVL